MPEGRLPDNYGKDEAEMPGGFVGQVALSFRR
jgi:hypothetical protein